MPVQDLTAIMSDYTVPSGTVSADSEYLPASRQAWRAFDDVHTLNSGWISGNSALPHWLEYQFAAPVTVTHYRFHGDPASRPRDFKLQGWIDATWNDLDTRTSYAGYSGVFPGWSDTFAIASPASYTRYRLYITATNGPIYVYIDEMELIGFEPSYEVPAVEWGEIAEAPIYAVGDFAIVPAAEWAETAEAPSYTVGPISLTVPAATWGWEAMPVAVALDPDTSVPASIVYRCTLTGLPDAKTDVVLPISSLQTRLRSGASSYVSVVVPNGASYAQAIADRPNGKLVIERGYRFANGSVQLVEIARVTLDQIGSDKGGRNWSITLTGYATSTTAVPKSRTLTGISYRASSGSGRRFRADLDLNLKPGDTAICGDESVVVATITHTVSPAGETMEISEQVGV